MIRFDGMSPDVMEAICTPMHQILPVQFPSQSMPPIQSVANTSNLQPGSLYLGSMSATMDRELLSNHHITHVVQVLDVPWLPISEKDGFRCLRIDILDKPSADLRPHLEGACQYIAHALQTGGNVLVHCQQGVSRSPAIVIAYLIHDLGMSYEQAYALVKRRRPCINPNPGFVAALRAWEERWRASAPPPPPQMRRFNTSYTSSATGTAVRPPPSLPQLPRGMSYNGNCNAGVS
ncbi:phosphatases II [Rhizopogon vinicolor AM-OR11-026]|uniref:protein-tyrosine-phosphatase n=1 Tax=Rhizopogon vinicolor AM-OR11-026 TaxID=1314800 RepID=A0A1B7MNH9_9AGAM|nr:phosphatases II [Rhizopogon vinicolor AM-OR11-026]